MAELVWVSKEVAGAEIDLKMPHLQPEDREKIKTILHEAFMATQVPEKVAATMPQGPPVPLAMPKVSPRIAPDGVSYMVAPLDVGDAFYTRGEWPIRD